MPDKAVILAAGFGTRLLPLTRVVPKPLLPLGGIPMIDRALALARSWGVRDVLVNVHHNADAMVAHLARRAPDGLRVQISFEPEILGTGGALARASWFLGDGRPFWMLNADVAARVDGRLIARAFRPGVTIASAWLMATRGPRTVACRDGVITNFESPTPRAEGTFTFCGVHMVDPAVLRYLPPEGFSSIIAGYQKAMADGWRVAGVPVERAWWADIGTPEQYVQAETEVDRADVATPSSRGSAAGVSIKAGFIYGPHVPRKRYAGIMAMRAADALDAAELAVARTWRGLRDDAVACPLAPRGSARSFTRLYGRGGATAMLVRHKPEREENNLYAGHARFLAGLGLPVPRVIAEDAAARIAVFEDVGELSVQDLTPRRREAILDRLYRRVLDAVRIMHEEGGRRARRQKLTVMPPFDAKLYAWEHDLFCNLFVREWAGADAATEQAIRQELRGVAEQLLAARPVLVHRDLQSSNILLRGHRWGLIDFQGMRFGPAVYDLASLLCDPYIRIAPARRAALLAHYAARADAASRVAALFWPAAVQRLGQALGAYVRLSRLPGTGHFARFIAPGLENMAGAAARVPGLPVLSAFLLARKDKTR